MNAALPTASSDPRHGMAGKEGTLVLKDAFTDYLPDVLIKEIAGYSFKW